MEEPKQAYFLKKPFVDVVTDLRRKGIPVTYLGDGLDNNAAPKDASTVSGASISDCTKWASFLKSAPDDATCISVSMKDKQMINLIRKMYSVEPFNEDAERN